MKRKSFTILAVLLIVGLLFAALPTGQVQAATPITLGSGQATLLGADAVSSEHFIGSGAWSANGQTMEFYLVPGSSALPPSTI